MVGSLQTFKKKKKRQFFHQPWWAPCAIQVQKRKLKVYELYQPLRYYWMDLIDELFHLFGTNVLF